MPLYLSPVCNDQTFDANGDPLIGGQVETYLAGSSTPAATYTDNTGSTPQSNPIILNTLGFPSLGQIWLTGGISYKFVIKNSMGSTLRTLDNIAGINDASVSQSEWVESGFVPTYINATSFSVPGDQTMVLQINRRLRTTNTSGLIYSTISNSVFAAGITTVTVVNDSGTLDAGLSAIAYGLLAADNRSIPPINLAGAGAVGVLPLSKGGLGVTNPLDARAVLEVPRGIQPVDASVASNALTLTLNPTNLDFRSATLTSGAVVNRVIASAINLVISSGSTLGTISASVSRVALLAIDNAGTVELAAVNAAGSFHFDESQLISTTAEGGAGGADSGNVVYSATARSNVAWRLVGFVDSTQATAGTWATAPSKKQGAGGLSFPPRTARSWQDMSASRALGTTYTNPFPYEIELSVSIGLSGGSTSTLTVNGSGIANQSSGGTSENKNWCITIPPGSTYSISATGTSISAWWELR